MGLAPVLLEITETIARIEEEVEKLGLHEEVGKHTSFVDMPPLVSALPGAPEKFRDSAPVRSTVINVASGKQVPACWTVRASSALERRAEARKLKEAIAA